MADGAAVRAGTAGGTINVVTDEITSPYSGSTEHAQGIKILDGAANATTPARVTSAGELVVNQQNNGTVSVTGTPNVHITNAATATLTGTNPVFVTNSGTVGVSSLPGGITGFAEDAAHTTGDVGIQSLAVRKNVPAALAGADGDYTPQTTDDVGATWAHVNDGTVAIKGNVVVGNSGTVSISAITPGTGASNLGKAEDAAHTTGDVGVMALAVRSDAGGAFGADGDYVPLSTDSSGAVRVTGGGGGVQYTEGDTDTTITGTAALAEGPGNTLEALQLDASKHLQVDIAADSVGIGGGVQYVEDVAHSSGGTGTMSLGVRKNVAAALADTDGDYIPAIYDSSGALWTHANDGTVAIKGNVVVGNNGTVSVSSLPGGITGFAEDAAHTTGDVGIQSLAVRKNVAAALAGADADYTPLITDDVGAVWSHVNDGTVAVKGNVLVGNNGTVSVSSIAAGDNNIGNVDVLTLPGGITGFAEDAAHTTGDVGIPAMAVRKNVAAALAGADADYTPLISDDVGAVWTHVNDGTVAIKGNVLVGNNGTVSITGTPNVHITNAATVTATDLDIRNLTITNDAITKGSATIGLGYTLGGTNILLTASGTVVPSVSSRVLYVTHEAFTVQGGTVTITARNGDGGGTLWGPMQFSPTGGIAASLPIEDGGLYETASGSAVYYVLAGSGTVGGRIRWARLAS